MNQELLSLKEEVRIYVHICLTVQILDHSDGVVDNV